jgi:hypothetical protein
MLPNTRVLLVEKTWIATFINSQQDNFPIYDITLIRSIMHYEKHTLFVSGTIHGQLIADLKV